MMNGEVRAPSVDHHLSSKGRREGGREGGDDDEFCNCSIRRYTCAQQTKEKKIRCDGNVAEEGNNRCNAGVACD